MKKLSLENLKLEANDMLQREQLKTIFGGYNDDGSCTVTLTCNTGSVSCTSETGDCSRGWGTITCDNISYEC